MNNHEQPWLNIFKHHFQQLSLSVVAGGANEPTSLTEVPVIQDVGGEERSFSDALGSQALEKKYHRV